MSRNQPAHSLGWIALIAPFFVLVDCVPAEPLPIPRCDILPLPHDEVSFRIHGEEKVRWHFAEDSPRPFFFPLHGPAGGLLTRMGHPGAANHDHHRSVWFAHHDVGGVNFWNDRTDSVVRQKHWLAYEDGPEEAIMAVSLGWYDGEGAELLEQELIVALRPLEAGEYAFELQTTFSPGGNRKRVTLGQTNFGFLAVRVAKSISEYFGGGILTGSSGEQHESNLFGKPARWMDYSGPTAVEGSPSRRVTAVQGITYFDHPDNPGFPSHWHVRQDGWMGASLCFEESFEVSRDAPLHLRYLLHAHRGPYRADRAGTIHDAFTGRPPLEVVKRERAHGKWNARRMPLETEPSSPRS